MTGPVANTAEQMAEAMDTVAAFPDAWDAKGKGVKGGKGKRQQHGDQGRKGKGGKGGGKGGKGGKNGGKDLGSKRSCYDTGAIVVCGVRACDPV